MGKQIKTLLEAGRNRAYQNRQQIALKAKTDTDNFLANRADRLPQEEFNQLVDKCEDEAVSYTDAESSERLGELESLTNRTPQENAEKIALQRRAYLKRKHGESYVTPSQRRAQTETPTDNQTESELFLYDPEDETLQEGLSSEEKQVIAISTKNQYAGADKNTIIYQIAILKDKLKKEKDRYEKSRIKHQISVLQKVLASSKKLDEKLKIKEK